MDYGYYGEEKSKRRKEMKERGREGGREGRRGFLDRRWGYDGWLIIGILMMWSNFSVDSRMLIYFEKFLFFKFF